MSHTEKDAMSILRAALIEARKWLHPFDQELAITRIDDALAATQPERSEGMPAEEELYPGQVQIIDSRAPVALEPQEGMPAGAYPYDALFQAIGDSLDSTVKIAGAAISISVKAFVESIRSKGYDITPAAPVQHDASETNWNAVIDDIADALEAKENLNLVSQFTALCEEFDRRVLASEAKADAAPVGEVVPCDDYGVTIRWVAGIPALGTKLYTQPPPATVSNTTAGASIESDAELLAQARSALDAMLNKRGYGCGEGSDHQVETHNEKANKAAQDAIKAIDARRAPAVGMVAAPQGWAVMNVWERAAQARMDVIDALHAKGMTPEAISDDWTFTPDQVRVVLGRDREKDFIHATPDLSVRDATEGGAA